MITDLVVMQPIDLCNLNCSYCYVPGRRDPKIMSNEVLEASFQCIFNSSMVMPISSEDTLKIIWHAGEPMTAGIKFYEHAFSLLEKYNTKKIKVRMEMQTNATLINQTWCDFLKQRQFSIGISIDGPEFIHDRHRKDWKGKGSFKKVMNGINLLRANKMPLHAICVLTKDSLDYPEEIYKFFKENEFESVGFNIDEIESMNQISSLKLSKHNVKNEETIKKYQAFMSSIFKLWEEDSRKISIREFNGIISLIKVKKSIPAYYRPSHEILAFGIVVITKNGDISTFSPELAGGTVDDPNKFFIGNVLSINSLDQLVENKNFKTQLSSIKKGIENCADQCSYFDLCGGGSPSNKFYEKGTFEATETSYCILTKQVLADVVINALKEP